MAQPNDLALDSEFFFVYTIKFQFKSRWLAPFLFSALFMAFFESYMVASLNPYTWQLWFAFFIVTVSFKPSVFGNKNWYEKVLEYGKKITIQTDKGILDYDNVLDFHLHSDSELKMLVDILSREK